MEEFQKDDNSIYYKANEVYNKEKPKPVAHINIGRIFKDRKFVHLSIYHLQNTSKEWEMAYRHLICMINPT